MIPDEITYTAARNPQWSNSNHDRIDVEVNFSHLEDEWVRCTVASANTLPEEYTHIHNLYAEIKAGNYGDIADEPFDIGLISSAENGYNILVGGE